MARYSAKYGTALYGQSQYGLIYGDKLLNAKITTQPVAGPQISRILDSKTLDTIDYRTSDDRVFE